MFNPLDIGSFANFLAMESEEVARKKAVIDHAIAEVWEQNVMNDFDKANEIFHSYGLDLYTMSEDEFKYVKENLR
jgi:hypothetical protein